MEKTPEVINSQHQPDSSCGADSPTSDLWGSSSMGQGEGEDEGKGEGWGWGRV